MMKEELKALFLADVLPEPERILDDVILNCFQEDFLVEVFSVYKKFVSMKNDAPESMKNTLFSTIRNFAQDCKENKQFVESLVLYRFLIAKHGIVTQDYPFIAEVLAKLEKQDQASIFINLYKQKEENLPLKYITLGNFYNIYLKDYKRAINYYEKYIEIDKTKSVIYTILADLYSKAYGDDSLEKQLEYWHLADNLKPNDRLIYHGLAFCSEKLEQNEEAQKYYEWLINNNPTASDYYNYGAFLIHCGDFKNGHKYFKYRNLIQSKTFEKTLTPDIVSLDKLNEDLSDKVVLVHYEQGFGDTIMYSRYLPELKKKVKKVIFVAQDELYTLIRGSKYFEGIEIHSNSEEISSNDYDLAVMLLDVPMLLENPNPEICSNKGYLDVSLKQVEAYKKKYLSGGDKCRIGISFSGDKEANYDGRNVSADKFKILLNLKNVQLYSLQKDGVAKFDGIISLGQTFNNFCDTACAIKNMDLVISTDNVILNLAGALGVKTIGLFNKQTNYRWYKLSNDVGWYKSVYPIQACKNDDWDDVFEKLYKVINI